MLHRSVSFLLAVVLLFVRFTLPGQSEAGPCGSPTVEPNFLPLIIRDTDAMAQPTILENLEEIMNGDAAFPFDAVITQIFTNTVNVKPVGSRTIIRDVALPEFIKADDLHIGYPVRLGHSGSKVTVEAYFEQFADPESFNYAGLGSKIPGKPSLTVTATKAGWVLTWPKVTYATKYLVYQNDTADGDSPELVQTLSVTNPNLASYTLTLHYDSPFIYFAVQACNGLLEGDLSLWKTDVTPPVAPTWKNHAYQKEGHYLEWTHPAPADVMEFVIYRNWQLGDPFAAETTRTANLNTIVDYVEQSDYFGVQAVDWSGNNKSAIVWWGPYDPTPATPPNFRANMDRNGGFICTWDAPAKAVSYIVHGYDYSVGEAGDGEGTYYTGSELQTPVIRVPSVTSFRVAAVGIDGSQSAWSAWETDDNPPPKPVLSIVNGAKQVTLSLAVTDTSHSSWGLDHYYVEIADDTNGLNYAILDDNAPYSSFPRVIAGDTGVTKYYRVTAFDWIGNASLSSDWTAGTPITFGEGGATIQDKFDGYGGISTTSVESLYWLYIHDFRNNSGADSWWSDWFKTTPAPRSTTGLIDGTTSLHLVSGAGNQGVAYYFHPTGGWDYSQDGRFGNNDYVMMAVYVSNAATLTSLTLSFDVGTDGGLNKVWNSGFVTGWNYLKAKKSEFAAWGDPVNWNYIGNLTLRAQFNTATGSPYVDVDDLRIVKAHPTDPTKTSDVGTAWEFATSSGSDTGQWHIYSGNRFSEPGKPFSFGQINTVASPTAWYLAHKPTDVNITSGTIQTGIFHKENGKNGLAFFIKNVTAGQWTMYTLETDNVADTIVLAKWVGGTRTQIASASIAPFISASGGVSGQIMWVGADFSQYDADGGRIKVYASPVEGNLIQAGNLKISVQDTSVGSGGMVGLLSNKTGVRFVNFTAGSPAHADVADVAKALDGPIIAGDKRRVHYSLTNNRFEYTDDGSAMVAVGAAADVNKVDRVSAARPGVTRLYRRDNDSAYNVQTWWDNTYWVLQGYATDTYHAGCRVAYADGAGNVGGYNYTDLHAHGQVVQLTSDITGKNGDYTVVWQSSLWNTQTCWDNATKLVAQRTGWHIWFCSINITPTANTDNSVAYCYLNGGSKMAQHNDRRSASTQGGMHNLSGIVYMNAGSYLEIHTTIGAINYNITGSAGGSLFGLLSLEKA
jgi:hypothetical protein